MRTLVTLLIMLNVGLFLAASQRPPPPLPITDINPEGLRLLAEAPEAPVPDLRACLQLGPFPDTEARRVARTLLLASDIEARALGGAVPRYRTLEVYLGPFASEEEAAPTLARLNRLALEYERVEADEAQIILLLGFFTQSSLAEQFVRYYAAQELPVQTRTEYRPLEGGHWLEVEVAEGREAGIAELLPEVNRRRGGCSDDG